MRQFRSTILWCTLLLLLPRCETVTPDAEVNQCGAALDPGSSVNWRHTTSKITAWAGDPNYRGQDVIVRNGQAVTLIGKFAYDPLAIDKDIKDEDVRIFMQPNGCDPWSLLTTVRTSEENEYGNTYGIEDDGGRAFYVLPQAKHPGLGRHQIEMVMRADLSSASFDLVVVNAGKKAVVFDVDGTLTTGDGELIEEIVASLIGNAHPPSMYSGANSVAQAYAKKGYQIIYLTARPGLLARLTRKWLTDRGFPRGVLHYTEGLTLSSSNVRSYKRTYLRYLKNTVGLDIRYAYGNATTDIQAYNDAGIPKSRTYIIGKHAGESGTQPLNSYTAHLPFVNSL